MKSDDWQKKGGQGGDGVGDYRWEEKVEYAEDDGRVDMGVETGSGCRKKGNGS